MERAHTRPLTAVGRRLQGRAHTLLHNRHLVRAGLVMMNLLLLAGISWFGLRGALTGQVLSQNAATPVVLGETADRPLDQLSSADIAVNASRVTGLYETPGVVNQAQSVSAELVTAPADQTVVAKPQSVATTFASNKDIKTYVVLAGDTVSAIAAKFNITSESIMWSNNLRGNTVNAGISLVIPPVSGIVYTVQNGDTVDSLASKYRANKDQIVLVNDIELTGLKVGDRILIPNGQQPVAPAIISLPGFASYGPYNGYDRGFCTWYAANRRAELGRPVPSNLGNANTWAILAANFGIPTGPTPQVGAVAVQKTSAPTYVYPGHVAIVEAVDADGGFWISEMNAYGQRSMTDPTPYGGWGRVDWEHYGPNAASYFTYIY